MKYDSVVFDFSGTIADDRETVVRTTNGVLRSYGRPEIDQQEWLDRMTLDFRSFWDGLEVTAPLSELQDRFRACYANSPAPVIIPGVKDTLQLLAERIGKERMDVLSATPPEYLTGHLVVMGIDQYFSTVRGGAPNKLEALQPYRGDRTLYVADMEDDAQAARACGMDFAAVDNDFAYHPRERLAKYNPTHWITHFRELVGIVCDG